MRLANTLVLNSDMSLDDQVTILQRRLDQLYTFTQGRVSFGTGNDGDRGQNIEGQWVQFTSSVMPNAENTIPHDLGSIPVGYIVMWQDRAGSVYGTPISGTAWTTSNVYLKSSVAGATYMIFLVKKGAS